MGGGFKFEDAVDVAVTAPGDGVVVSVTSSEFLVSPMRQGVTDYGLVFHPCDEIVVEFAHVVTLDDTLAEALGVGDCEVFVGPDETVRDCSYSVHVALSAGDAIGTTGLYQNGEPTGLDFSAIDRPVEPDWLNPARIGGVDHYLHGICSCELFEAALANSYIALAASGLNPLMRATDPCGTTRVDFPGSAQGVWVRQDNPTTLAEDLQQDAPNFLTLAPDVVDPAGLQAISPGVLELQTLLITMPRESSGRVNRDFAEVPNDGTLHCYEGVHAGMLETHSFLLAVVGEVLTIERLLAPCSGDDPASWAFGAAAIPFIR